MQSGQGVRLTVQNAVQHEVQHAVPHAVPSPAEAKGGPGLQVPCLQARGAERGEWRAQLEVSEEEERGGGGALVG